MFIPNKNKFPPDPENPHFFNISLQKGTLKSSFQIDIHQGALFVNIPSYSSCSYTEDRSTFIFPLINKLAQVMRAFKMPVIRIVPQKELRSTDIQRKRGLAAIKGGKTLTGEIQIRSSEYAKHLSIFDMTGKCMYQSSPRFEESFHKKDIIPHFANGYKDLYISEISKAVYAIAGSGAKYVFICGENLNSELTHVIYQCSQAGITPILVNELVDCDFVYELAKVKASSHSDFLRDSIHHLTMQKAYSIHYDELLTSLVRSRLKASPVRYLKENNTAPIFVTL